MNKVYCDACGIEVPKSVLEKNPQRLKRDFRGDKKSQRKCQM